MENLESGKVKSIRKDLPRLAFLALLATEIAALKFVIIRDPVTLYNILSVIGAPKVATTPSINLEFSKDPAHGSLLDNIGIGQVIRSSFGRVEHGILLVPVGDCASCLKADLRTWQLHVAKLHVAFGIITTASPEVSKTFMKRLRILALVINDTNGQFVKDWNVLWNGISYYFGSDWKLKWVEKSLTADDPFNSAELQRETSGDKS